MTGSTSRHGRPHRVHRRLPYPGSAMTEPTNTPPEPEPDTTPMSRRTTILIAIAAVLAIAVVAGIILVAVSGDDDPASTVSSSSSSSSVVTQTVTETPSTTEAPPTTTDETTTTTPESSASSTTPQDNPGGLVVYDCGGQPQVRPTDVTSIYCGDNSVSVSDITWTRWGPRSAVGTGTESVNLCRPNCAAGNYEQRQVDVVLGGPERKTFTTITLTGTDGVTQTYELTGNAPN